MGDIVLPEQVGPGYPITLEISGHILQFKLLGGELGGHQLGYETGRDEKTAWIDIVLYDGAELELDFNKLGRAYVMFGFSIYSKEEYKQANAPEYEREINTATDEVTLTMKTMDGTSRIVMPIKPRGYEDILNLSRVD